MKAGTTVPIAHRSVFSRFPFYYGWVHVPIAGVLFVTCIAGSNIGLGLITEPLLKELHISRLYWANITMWASLIGMLFIFPTGKLIDRHGVRPVITPILVLLGLTVIGMSHATTTGQLWATTILSSSLGNSALSLASLMLVGKWFGRRITLAIGVFTIISKLGYSFVFLIFGPAITTYGWRGPWQLLGCVILFVFAPVCWLAVRSTPESAGITSDLSDVSAVSEPNGSGMTWKAALRTQPFWLFAISSAFVGMTVFAIALFYESILLEHGFDMHVRDELLSLQMIAGLFISFAAGWVGQRWSLGKMMAFALAMLTLAFVLLANLSSMTDVIVYALVMSVPGAMMPVIAYSVWRHTYGPAHLASIQSIAKTLSLVSQAIGPRILAQVQANTGSYVPAFYVFAMVSAVLSVWAWCVPVRRWAGTISPIE